MNDPEAIRGHATKFREAAWRDYTPEELGNWVHLLVKRAHMRNPDDKEKIAKDLSDARNYHLMLGEHVADAVRILIDEER